MSFLRSFSFLAFALLSLAASTQAAIVTFDFSTNPILAPSYAADAWFPDRKAPNAFKSTNFLGGDRLEVGLVSSDYDSGNNFYNTQGRKYNISVAEGGSFQAELYVPLAWQTAPSRSDFWATGVGSQPPSSPTAYMIFGFTSLSGTPRFRVFDSDIGWVDLTTPVVYDQWYSLRMEFRAGEFAYFINGTSVFTDVSINGTTFFQDVMLQAFNTPATYSAYWDNLVIDTAIPEPSPLGLLALGIGCLFVMRRKLLRSKTSG